MGILDPQEMVRFVAVSGLLLVLYSTVTSSQNLAAVAEQCETREVLPPRMLRLCDVLESMLKVQAEEMLTEGAAGGVPRAHHRRNDYNLFGSFAKRPDPDHVFLRFGR